METSSTLYTTIMSWLARRKFDTQTAQIWIHIIIILTAVAIIYANSLTGEFLNIDDMRNLSVVLEHPPITSFVDHSYVWFSTSLYRPIFFVLTGVFYELFGLNFLPMQASILCMHALTSVVVYQAIRKMSGNNTVGLLTALVYTSSFIIGILVTNWLTDAAPLTNFCIALTLLLLVTPSDKKWWYGMLFACLLLAPISRENGLVLIGGVGLYTLYNGYWGVHSYSRTRTIILLCIIATAIYFTLRIIALDAPGLPSSQDSVAQIITISQVVTSNFIAVFIPLLPALDVGYSLINIIFGTIHSLISIVIIVGLIRGWPTIPRKDQALIILGSTFIVLGSIIPLLYFRYRNLNTPYFGWLILLAVFLSQRLPNIKRKLIRSTIYGALFYLIIFSSMMIMVRLPNSTLAPTLENAQELCRTNISEDLAIEIATWNEFDVKPILACRK